MLDLVSCECQRCCTRERGGQTTEQVEEGEGREGMVVVTMRSRVRYGIAGDFGRLSRNEHKILRLFRRTPISRFLYLELSVPNIFPAPSVLSLLSPALRPYLLTRASALVVFFTLLFGVSTSFTSSPPPLAAPPASSLLSRPGSFQTLLHSWCEIAFKLFGFLTRLEDLSCGTLVASRRGCRST